MIGLRDGEARRHVRGADRLDLLEAVAVGKVVELAEDPSASITGLYAPCRLLTLTRWRHTQDGPVSHIKAGTIETKRI